MPTPEEVRKSLELQDTNINISTDISGKPVKGMFGSIVPQQETFKKEESYLDRINPLLPTEYKINTWEKLINTVGSGLGAIESLPPMIIASTFPNKFPKTAQRIEKMKKGEAVLPSFGDILQDFGAPTIPALIGGMALDMVANPFNVPKFKQLSELGKAFESLKTVPKSIFKDVENIDDVIKNTSKLNASPIVQNRITQSLEIIKNSPEAIKFMETASPNELKTYLLGNFEELHPKLVEDTLKGYENIFQIKLPFLKPIAPFKKLQTETIKQTDEALKQVIKTPEVQLFTTSTGDVKMDNFLKNIDNRGNYLKQNELNKLNDLKNNMLETVNDYLKSTGQKTIKNIINPKSVEDTKQNLYKIMTSLVEQKELNPEQVKRIEDALSLINDDIMKSKIATKLGEISKFNSDQLKRILKVEKIHAIPIQELEDNINYIPRIITKEGKNFIDNIKNVITDAPLPEISKDPEAIYKWIKENVKPVTYKAAIPGTAFKRGYTPTKQRITAFQGLDRDAVDVFMKNLGFGYDKEMKEILNNNPYITAPELVQIFKNKPVVKEFFTSNPLEYMTKRVVWHANKINLSETVMDVASKFGQKANKILPNNYTYTEKGIDLIKNRSKKDLYKIMNPSFKSITPQLLEDNSIQKYRKIRKDGKTEYIPLNQDEALEFSKNKNLFIKDIPQNMAGIDDYNFVMANYKFPTEIAGELNKYFKSIETPEQIKTSFKGVFDVVNFWKKLITLRPKYWSSNFISNIINNSFEGLKNPQRYFQAHQIQVADAMIKNGVWNIENVKPVVLRTVNGRYIDAYKLYKMYAEKYLLNTGFFMRDLQRSNTPLSKNALQALSKGKVFESASIANTWMENNSKLAMFFDRIIKGDTIEKAIETTQKVTFNMNDFTKTEKALRKSLIPFYAWKKKNLVYHVQKMLHDPGIYSSLNIAGRDTQRVLQEITDENPDVRDTINTSMETLMPAWMRKMVGITLVNEKGEVQKFPIDRFFPPADVLTIATMPESLVSMITPFIAKPIQYGMDFNFFTKRPFSEDIYQPKYGSQLYHNFFGFKITNPVLWDVLNSIPGLSDLNKLNPGNIFGSRTSESKVKDIGKKYLPFIPDSAWAKMKPEEIRNKQENLFNYLIGRVYKLDPFYNKFRLEQSIKKIPQQIINDLMKGNYSYVNGLLKMERQGDISDFEFEKYKNEYLKNVRKEDVPNIRKQVEEAREELRRNR